MDPFYEKFAPLLGHIAIEHGNLEGDAGRMLARLNEKGDDFSAARYAAKNTFNEKIDKSRKLVSEKIADSELRDEFESVLSEMTRLNRARNRYLHSEYLPEVDANGKVTQIFYRQIKQMSDVIDTNDPNSEIAVHSLNLHDVKKLIKDMASLGLRIRVVSEKYFDSLP